MEGSAESRSIARRPWRSNEARRSSGVAACWRCNHTHHTMGRRSCSAVPRAESGTRRHSLCHIHRTDLRTDRRCYRYCSLRNIPSTYTRRYRASGSATRRIREYEIGVTSGYLTSASRWGRTKLSERVEADSASVGGRSSANPHVSSLNRRPPSLRSSLMVAATMSSQTSRPHQLTSSNLLWHLSPSGLSTTDLLDRLTLPL